MKSLTAVRNILGNHKKRLVEKYGLKFIAIFGSYGREQQGEGSDVDILVDFDKPVGMEFIDLANELEKILNIKVDLVSRNGIKLKYLKYIEKDLSYV